MELDAWYDEATRRTIRTGVIAALFGVVLVPLAAGTATADHVDRCEGAIEEAKCKAQDMIYCVEPLVNEFVHDLKCDVGRRLNHPPDRPPRPEGPDPVERGDAAEYCTEYSDPDGNEGFITFRWDDGESTRKGPVESGSTVCASHTWSSSDLYCVSAAAEDKYGQPSEESECRNVWVDENNAPDADQPDGPESGTRGTSYEYCASADDPEGDDVRVTFDWDDGSTTTTDYKSSGSTFCATHTWPEDGDTSTFYVQATAEDEHGKSGDGSDYYLEVTMYRTNDPPGTPSAPSGPTMGDESASHEFCSSADDPDGSYETLDYKFRWDDGSATRKSGYDPGEQACAGHTWDDGTTGVSEWWVSVKVEDEFGETATSDSTRLVLQDDADSRADAPSIWNEAVAVADDSWLPWNYIWKNQGDEYDKYTFHVSDGETDSVVVTPREALDGTCRNVDLRVWDPSGDPYESSTNPGCEQELVNITPDADDERRQPGDWLIRVADATVAGGEAAYRLGT